MLFAKNKENYCTFVSSLNCSSVMITFWLGPSVVAVPFSKNWTKEKFTNLLQNRNNCANLLYHVVHKMKRKQLDDLALIILAMFWTPGYQCHYYNQSSFFYFVPTKGIAKVSLDCKKNTSFKFKLSFKTNASTLQLPVLLGSHLCLVA